MSRTGSNSSGGSSRSASSSSVRPSICSSNERRPLLLLASLIYAVAYEFEFVFVYNGVHASADCDITSTCSSSDRNGRRPACLCHKNCSLYDACCEDVRPSDWRLIRLPPDAYECAVYPRISTAANGDHLAINGAAFVFLITKCPITYSVPYIAKLCDEQHSNIGSSGEQLRKRWVTDNVTGITFSNQFCALCYGTPANRIASWKVYETCINEPTLVKFGLSGCMEYAFAPEYLTDVIPVCSGSYVAECHNGSSLQMQEACTDSPARYVYDSKAFVTYRNYNCSLCTDEKSVVPSTLRCTPPALEYGAPFNPDLRGLLGADTCPEKISTFATKDDQATVAELCPKTVFDTENCSETVNVTTLLASYDGNDTSKYRIVSHGVRMIYNMSYTLCYRCQPIALLNFTFQSDNVKELATNTTYPMPLFQVEANGSVTVCSAARPIELPPTPCSDLPSEVGVVLMSLSLLGLTFYAVAYAMLTSLRNLPGQIMLHQSAAFFAAFLLWLVRAPTRHLNDACVALGILTHFFFLAAFTWTAIYAFEVVHAFGIQAYGAGSTKRRLRYILVGWLVPSIVTAIAIAVNWALPNTFDPSFRPAYGAPQCFINNPLPHRIFFIAPLAVFLIIDLGIYAYVIVQLVLISGQTKVVRQNHHEKLALAVKLVFALGITWVFAVLATATGNCYIEYIFTLLNSLQGVFLFLIFICNPKVLKQIDQKICGRKPPSRDVVTASSQELSSSMSNIFSSQIRSS